MSFLSFRTVVLQVLIVLSFVSFPHLARTENFVKIGHVRYAGDRLSTEDIEIFGKSDYLDVSRFLWHAYRKNYGDNIFLKIREKNPEITIVVYMQGPNSIAETDTDPYYRTSIARVFKEDAPPNGTLESKGLLFPRDNGEYVAGVQSKHYLARFGEDEYAGFWYESVLNDLITQEWFVGADGVFIDDCGLQDLAASPPDVIPYNTAAGRQEMLIQMVKNISELAHTGQLGDNASIRFTGKPTFLTNPNILPVFEEGGVEYWQRLDSASTDERPDILFEEGAFFHRWWNLYAITWLSEAKWKAQIDMIDGLKNCASVWRSSHRMKDDGELGEDNNGKKVSHWQALWYGMGSLALGKKSFPASYFIVSSGDDPYGRTTWYAEYDELDGGKLDMGSSVGSYRVTVVNGINIYVREFAKGWVLVNPTQQSVGPVNFEKNFDIIDKVRHIHHENIEQDIATIPSVKTIDNFEAHTAVFLRKADIFSLPEPPSNFKIFAQ